MSDIKLWSNSASDNSFSPPDGWPEGMLPSAVNNVGREMMASIRRQWEQAAWFDYNHTPTFVTASIFKVPNDHTAIYTPDRRVRITDNGTLYGTITASNFISSETIVTVILDSGSLSGGISAVAPSILDATNTPVPAKNLFILDQSNQVSGASNFTGTNTFNGDVTLAGTNDVQGSINSSGTNTFTGEQTFSGQLNVQGPNTFSGSSNFTGALQKSGQDVYYPGNLTKVFPVAFGFPGEVIPNAERNILIPGSVTMSTDTNMPNAKARASIAPSGGSVVFNLRKNGSSIGNITFASGSNVGTFSSVASQSFAGDSDDRITVRCTSVDTQGISGVDITIYGRHSS